MHPGLLVMVAQIDEFGVREDRGLPPDNVLIREATDALSGMLSAACNADLTDQEVPGGTGIPNPPGETGQHAQDVIRRQTASDDFRDMMDTAANQLGTNEYIPRKHFGN